MVITRPTENAPTVQSIRQSVLRLSARLSKLKKEHNSTLKLSNFLNEPYSLPQRILAGYYNESSSCSSCSETEVLKAKLSTLEAKHNTIQQKVERRCMLYIAMLLKS